MADLEAERQALAADVARARAQGRAFGRFVILGELGKGGMGAVYRAWDERLARQVAVKVVLPEAATPEVLQRFQKEGQAVARLRHPNIVGIHEVGEHQGRPFLAMDFVAGATLEKRLATKTLAWTRGLEVLRDVARAVHFAHEQGVIHRDLKPANILLDATDRPFVMDFGIAKIRDDGAKLTKAGAMGTPAYMPPEQTEDGATVDERADVYSLGATLYQVLTGRPPFEGNDPFQVITALLTRDPPPPSQKNPRAAGDLETICLRCLEKDPVRRYRTAAALADELDRFLTGEPIEARPLGTAARLLKRARRNKLATALGALALGALATLVVLVALAVRSRRHLEEAQATELRRIEQARASAVKEERDAALRLVARARLDRSAQALLDGHHGDAALLAAKALALPLDDELNWAARARYRLAKRGPWRRPVPLVPATTESGTTTGDLAVSPDGQLVAVGRTLTGNGAGERIDLLELPPTDLVPIGTAPVRSATLRGTILVPGRRPGTLAFSPDGRSLAAAGGPGPLVFDVETRASVAPPGPFPRSLAPVESLAWLPGTRRLAFGGRDGQTRVWDLERAVLEPGQLRHGRTGDSPERGRVLALAWRRESELVSGGFDQVLVHPDGAGGLRDSVPFSQAIYALAFSPEGWLVAGGSGGFLALFRTFDRRAQKQIVTAHDETVTSLAYGPRLLATGSADKTVRLWDPAFRSLATLDRGHHLPVGAVAWRRPDHELLTVAAGEAVLAWDLGNLGAETCHVWTEGRALAWTSPLSYAVVTLDRHLHRVPTEGGEVSRTPLAELENYPLTITARPEDESVLVTDTGAVAVDQDGRRLPLEALRLAYQPRSRRLALGRGDGLHLCDDGPRGAPRAIGKTAPTALAWSPDGKLLATAECGRVHLRDADGTRDRELGRAPVVGVIESVAVSPGGDRVAAANGDGRVHVFWVDSPREVVVAADRRSATCVAWHPTLPILVTGGLEGRLVFWDLRGETPRSFLAIQAHERGVRAITPSPDGRLVASTGADGRVRTWPLADLVEPPPADEVARIEELTGLELPEGATEPRDRGR